MQENEFLTMYRRDFSVGPQKSQGRLRIQWAFFNAHLEMRGNAERECKVFIKCLKCGTVQPEKGARGQNGLTSRTRKKRLFSSRGINICQVA